MIPSSSSFFILLPPEVLFLLPPTPSPFSFPLSSSPFSLSLSLFSDLISIRIQTFFQLCNCLLKILFLGFLFLLYCGLVLSRLTISLLSSDCLCYHLGIPFPSLLYWIPYFLNLCLDCSWLVSSFSWSISFSTLLRENTWEVTVWVITHLKLPLVLPHTYFIVELYRILDWKLIFPLELWKHCYFLLYLLIQMLANLIPDRLYVIIFFYLEIFRIISRYFWNLAIIWFDVVPLCFLSFS